MADETRPVTPDDVYAAFDFLIETATTAIEMADTCNANLEHALTMIPPRGLTVQRGIDSIRAACAYRKEQIAVMLEAVAKLAAARREAQ